MAQNIGPKIGIEGEAKFRREIEAINRSLQTLKTEQNAVTSAFDKNDRSAEKLTAQNKVLTKQIEEQKKALSMLTDMLEKARSLHGEDSKEVQQWQQVVNRATAQLNKMELELKNNNEALNDTSKSTADAASSIDLFAEALAAEKLLDGIENLTGLLKDCVDASTDFESAMAGVAKTTDLSTGELAELGKDIKELSTNMPVAAAEIASIVESAGQLGIAKDNLLDFSTVMANLGVATNLSATEAASALAKFANITGMSASDYERLGSTIVGLGNNFATTESDIVSMATKLAATGSVVGLTESEILAMATALSSVGIEAEAGGSAMAKLLKKFETMVATSSPALEGFAKVAGMTAKEFADAWGKSPVKAIARFVDGLGDLEKSGGNATATMAELGLTEVRLSNAVLSLAKSDSILTDALELSTAAWDDNVALTREAETRYGTTESKFAMLENSINNLRIAIGDALTPALGELAGEGGVALDSITRFIEQNPAIVQALSALAVGLGVAAGAVTAMTAAVKLLTIATNTLGGPVIWVTTAIGGLIAAVVGLATFVKKDTSLRDAKRANEELARSVGETKSAYEQSTGSIETQAAKTQVLLKELRDLNAVTNKTAAQKALVASLVDELNSTVPDLALAYDAEKDSVIGLNNSIDDYIDKMYEQMRLEAQADTIKEMLTRKAEAEALLADNIKKHAEAQAEVMRLEQAYQDILNTQVTPENEATLGIELQGALGQLEAAKVALEVWGKTVADTERQVAEINTEIDNFKAGITAVEEAADTGDMGTEKFARAKAAIDNVADSMTLLQEEYYAAYDAAYDSIDKQTGLFKKLDNDASTSAAQIQQNLESQIQWMTSYAENLQNLSSRGLEGIETLVEALSDGSADSAAALAGLSEASDKEVLEIIRSMQQVEDSKGVLADTIAAEVTDVDARLEELEASVKGSIHDISSMDSAARQAASNVMQGLISGIDARSGALYSRMVSVGQSMIAGINHGTRSHSPSREAIKASGNVFAGLIVGVKQNEQKLDDLMEAVGERMVESIASEEAQEKVKQVIERYKTYLTDYADSITDALDEIEDRWDAVADKQSQMVASLQKYGDLERTRTIKWDDGTSQTLTELADLHKQIDALEEYGRLLEEIDSRGIDNSLMERVIGMQPDEATSYMRKLLDLTDEEFDEYNAAWQEKQQIAQEIAEKFYRDQLDALEKEYTENLDRGLDAMTDIAYKNGVSTVEGLIRGMQSEEKALAAEAARIGDIVSRAISTTLDIHSPSGVTEKLGEYTAEGFGLGYMKRMDELDRMIESYTPFTSKRDAAIVNAIGSVTSSLNSAEPAVITLQLPNGMEMARWLIDDIRSLNKSSPEIKNDF